MLSYRDTFHRISYLQYPLVITAFVYSYIPIFTDFSNLFVELNKGLVFLGLGISFSTLQDTTKVQNNFSKRVYQNPRHARIFIFVLIGQVIFFCATGLIALYMKEENAFSELGFGLISIGIGMIGLLKAAVEMAEHQQKLLKITNE